MKPHRLVRQRCARLGHTWPRDAQGGRSWACSRCGRVHVKRLSRAVGEAVARQRAKRKVLTPDEVKALG